MAAAAPNRNTVIDAVVLAFSSSRLVEVVGTDALRTLVSGIYVDMIESGSLDLQVLWDVLQDQPEFSWDAGTPPCCVIRRWQARLGIDVLLPAHLDILSEIEVAQHAEQVDVPEDAVAALFETAEQRADRVEAEREAGEQRAAQRERATQARSTEQRAAGWRERKQTAIAAAVVSAVALAFIGYTLMTTLGGPDWSALQAAEIEGGIPVATAEVMGTQVGVTLSDDGWLARPRDEIRAQLATALRGLQGRDVEVLFVKDSEGRPRVSAQWFEASIRTRFLR